MKNEKIKDYLLENIDVLKDIVKEINCWDGSLDYLDYYDNDEYFLNDMFEKPDDAVRAAYYGDYNYMDDYVRFNGYGNLESFSQYDYEEELKSYIDEIIERLEEEKDNITIYDNELKEMIEES